MKIDNRIIHYEINKQLPKRPENEIEGMGNNRRLRNQKLKKKIRQDKIQLLTFPRPQKRSKPQGRSSRLNRM